jgi:glycogen operon protein
MLRDANKSWHGVKLNQPDWGAYSHSLALGAELRSEGLRFHMIWNAYWEPLAFELPPLESSNSWRRWIDTALTSPEDIVDWQEARAVRGTPYQAGARSVVVVFAT